MTIQGEGPTLSRIAGIVKTTDERDDAEDKREMHRIVICDGKTKETVMMPKMIAVS